MEACFLFGGSGIHLAVQLLGHMVFYVYPLAARLFSKGDPSFCFPIGFLCGFDPGYTGLTVVIDCLRIGFVARLDYFSEIRLLHSVLHRRMQP